MTRRHPVRPERRRKLLLDDVMFIYRGERKLRIVTRRRVEVGGVLLGVYQGLPGAYLGWAADGRALGRFDLHRDVLAAIVRASVPEVLRRKDAP